MTTATTPATEQTATRSALVRRGRLLAWGTVGWNAVEGVIAVTAGLAASSIALIGFGADSAAEVLSGGAVLWRLAQERHGSAVGAAAERTASRVIAVTFLLLGAGVAVEAVRTLVTAARPDESVVGIVLAAVSLVVMPLLARAKRRVGERMGSATLQADASETSLCAWLSLVLLGGLALNALLGWWWADPLASLVIAAVALREGREAWTAETLDDCC